MDSPFLGWSDAQPQNCHKVGPSSRCYSVAEMLPVVAEGSRVNAQSANNSENFSTLSALGAWCIPKGSYENTHTH